MHVFDTINFHLFNLVFLLSRAQPNVPDVRNVASICPSATCGCAHKLSINARVATNSLVCLWYAVAHPTPLLTHCTHFLWCSVSWNMNSIRCAPAEQPVVFAAPLKYNSNFSFTFLHVVSVLCSHKMSIEFFQVPRARRYSAVSALSMFSFFCNPADPAPWGLMCVHHPGCIIELLAVQNPLHASQLTRTWHVSVKLIHHIIHWVQYWNISIDFDYVHVHTDIVSNPNPHAAVPRSLRVFPSGQSTTIILIQTLVFLRSSEWTAAPWMFRGICPTSEISYHHKYPGNSICAHTQCQHRWHCTISFVFGTDDVCFITLPLFELLTLSNQHADSGVSWPLSVSVLFHRLCIHPPISSVRNTW
jgi:hypothetical protein